MSINLEYSGSKIVLPIVSGKELSIDSAITWLMDYKDREEMRINFHQRIECVPIDGMVAFQRALAQKYGWSTPKATPGFFGPNAPVCLNVEVSPGVFEEVYYGAFGLPGIPGTIKISFDCSESPALLITGELKRKHEPEVKAMVALTRTLLESSSIFKGKAIRVNFDWQGPVRSGLRGYHPLNDAPKHFKVDPSLEHNLIFSAEVKNALNISLFTPIEKTDICRKHAIPLKRGVLLFGQYGTGKTLTASITALKAQRNNWTFIYLDHAADLAEGLKFAANYAPAVVFCEDIDRATNGERSVSLDSILNTLDGVDTKGAEIITVFTTNHVEQINPAMLRPGRLDCLVEVKAPDATAAAQLIQLYGRDLIDSKCNMLKIGYRLQGKIPAFIRETIERAKIAAIARTPDNAALIVQESDILQAADSLDMHHSLVFGARKKSDPKQFALLPVPSDKIGTALSMLSVLKFAGTSTLIDQENEVDLHSDDDSDSDSDSDYEDDDSDSDSDSDYEDDDSDSDQDNA